MTVTQSCPSLGNPVDCSPPGFSVPGILQARILEWIAISFLILRRILFHCAIFSNTQSLCSSAYFRTSICTLRIPFSLSLPPRRAQREAIFEWSTNGYYLSARWCQTLGQHCKENKQKSRHPCLQTAFKASRIR